MGMVPHKFAETKYVSCKWVWLCAYLTHRTKNSITCSQYKVGMAHISLQAATNMLLCIPMDITDKWVWLHVVIREVGVAHERSWVALGLDYDMLIHPTN